MPLKFAYEKRWPQVLSEARLLMQLMDIVNFNKNRLSIGLTVPGLDCGLSSLLGLVSINLNHDYITFLLFVSAQPHTVFYSEAVCRTPPMAEKMQAGWAAFLDKLLKHTEVWWINSQLLSSDSPPKMRAQQPAQKPQISSNLIQCN